MYQSCILGPSGCIRIVGFCWIVYQHPRDNTPSCPQTKPKVRAPKVVAPKNRPTWRWFHGYFKFQHEKNCQFCQFLPKCITVRPATSVRKRLEIFGANCPHTWSPSDKFRSGWYWNTRSLNEFRETCNRGNAHIISHLLRVYLGSVLMSLICHPRVMWHISVLYLLNQHRYGECEMSS